MTLKKLDESRYSVQTRLIYGKSLAGEWDYSHHVIPPITSSSTFRLDSTQRGAQGFSQIGTPPDDKGPPPIYVYERMGEPNTNLLQNALAIAEEGEVAVVFSTGMAAVHAALCFALPPGGEIISHQTVYGCTYSLLTNWLRRLGVRTYFCDLRTPESFLPLVNDNTRILYLESPSNPTLEFLDIELITRIVRDLNRRRSQERKILTVIDNTFATPFCQRPLSYGIDIVVHSLTKGISGFGVDVGGAVVTRREFYPDLIAFRKDFGAFLSPQTAWRILVYGLSTLPLRVPQQQANAIRIAQYLEAHPKVERVIYPGLASFPQHDIAKRILRDYDGNFSPGFMIFFTLKGNSPEASKRLGETMMNFIAQNAYTITLAVSLGQLRTLIEHPGSMSHRTFPAEEQLKLGINPGGIRLAVGVERAQDIIQDLEAALAVL